MAQLRPYIYSGNAREQAAFYAKALSGEIINVQTFGDYGGPGKKNKVMHLVLEAAGQRFYMADAESVNRGNGLDLTLEFAADEEAEQAFKALSEGGKIIMPFERMFWGAMFGRLEDAFGVHWQIATEMPEQNGS